MLLLFGIMLVIPLAAFMPLPPLQLLLLLLLVTLRTGTTTNIAQNYLSTKQMRQNHESAPIIHIMHTIIYPGVNVFIARTRPEQCSIKNREVKIHQRTHFGERPPKSQRKLASTGCPTQDLSDSCLRDIEFSARKTQTSRQRQQKEEVGTCGVFWFVCLGGRHFRTCFSIIFQMIDPFYSISVYVTSSG